MRDTMTESGRLTCADAAVLLEKRVAEEPLSDAEEQGLQQHLNHCEHCHRLVDWISALPGFAEELSGFEVRSAYQRAMENRARSLRAERRRKIAMALAAVAAVAAVVLIDKGMIRDLFSEEGKPAITQLKCLPAPPTQPVAGVVMTYCADRPPGVLAEDDGALRVSLQYGAVGLLVDPHRPGKHRVSVETPHGEVRVKGTMFTVLVDEENTWVEVFRGVVELIPIDAQQETLSMAAGRGADLGRRRISRLSSPRTESLRRVLDRESSRTLLATRGPVPAATPPEPDRTVSPAPSARRSPPGSSGSARSWGSAAKPVPEEESPVSDIEEPPKPSEPSIDTLIQEAQSCLLSHDWEGASSRYQDVLTKYPGSPESTAVLVSLAKLELRHLDRPSRALSHYRTYRDRAPRGPMAEEALFGIAETYRRMGDTAKEKETLQTFIGQYPGSSQIERARARLRRLEADSLQ